MDISRKDIKKLWGLAAGRCSYPGCGELCIEGETDDTFIIGEMAHVIAKRPSGRRGIPDGGDSSYDNLILLCPTHHKKIDQAPEGTFPEKVILGWKERHEAANTLASPTFNTVNDVANYIRQLLIENKTIWESYGPESAEASANPLSNLSEMWTLRKLDTIIPNNNRIIRCIQKNRNCFDNDSYKVACLFVEHAKGFEHSCYHRLERVPRFPQQFEEMVIAYAG